MLTNTLVILATDGTKMQALHYTGGKEKKRIIIHVHGMAGNFYENPFMEEIAANCKEVGIDYMCFNNRGHDYIADCERVHTEGSEFYNGGGAYENFTECIYDIEGAIRWAILEGYSDIFLEGHSSGSNKIVYSLDKLGLSNDMMKKVKGLILISPCDDIGVYQSEISNEDRDSSFKMAKSFMNNGEENALMPLGTFFDYLLSAKTFLECFVEDSPLDMFPYRRGNIKDTNMSKIEIPKLILFGDNGDFVLQEFDEIRDIYKQSAIQNYEICVINNANHSYKGCEKKLAENIVKWIERTF